ncbi:DNA invertase Pin-like site-specific DNA recombinase [Kibdelosporangium banguiense]|uniref:DNA invertase Pin-like site-specific DNA recombinase n=1 Tax=Kibdelosporangium banguiense TaxID=1365924 RepID=A0ABS4THK1_9PSEU|nr:recombinase family protein [Kibdelosporangium banguiense]MBP2323774.1 DNA invertase Pin-like site-specific DNA recombinase [Kibdelosporangium banguiense]
MYLRISEDREGDELGIDRHFEDLIGLFRARGWALDRRHVFVDNDLSAAGKRDRPDFIRMLQSVERGELGVLTAWMLDRLLRNRSDQVWLYESCERAKMLLAFARGSDIDMGSAAGQIVADILAAIARGEIKIKGERHQRAAEQAAKQGRRYGGRKPFGYEQDGMTIIPAEAVAVHQAYNDVLTGVPLAQIARDWNDAGLHSGQAKWADNRHGARGTPAKWKHDTVRLVLLNPRNAGIRRYKKEEVAIAQWPPIVPEETFRAVQDFLKDPSRYSGAKAEQQLLTGVALCGAPGCGLTVHGGGARHGKPVYRCQSMRHVNRLAKPVEEFIGKLVVARMSRKDAVELLMDTKRLDAPALRKELVTKRTRLEQIAVEFADDETVTPAQLRAMTGRLRERITEIEAELADAGRVDVLGPLVRSKNVAATWKAMSRAKQRLVIDTLMVIKLHKVGRGVRTFRSETVEIEWKHKLDDELVIVGER